MIASAQGSRVYWGGRLIGRITSAKAAQSAGGEFDCTSMSSPVVGDGVNTRVVRQVNPVDISPAVVTLELLGGTQFTRDDIGRTAPMSVITSGGTLSGEAYLADFSADAVTGEKLKSTATFKFTGF
jgi:hypothetical protein